MSNIPPFEIKNGLVALDLSDVDDTVLDYINFLAGNTPIHKLRFIHVVRKVSFLTSLRPWNRKSYQSELSLNTDVGKHLKEKISLEVALPDDVEHECEVLEGDPLAKILEVGSRDGSDLLIIGRKTKPNTYGVFARNLTRRINSSVLMVPPHPSRQLKTIIVPIDFSENSGKALQTALAINDRLEKSARIVCLHVYELPDIHVYQVYKTEEQLQKIVEADIADAFDKFMEKYGGDLSDLPYTQLALKKDQNFAERLYEIAQGDQADLIVIGAKGHSAVERLFLGSVTERFLQINETIPTIIVR